MGNDRSRAVLRRAVGVAVGIVLATLPVFADPSEPATHGVDTPLWNVLLVSIDSLRADHLKSYGYDRETSPNLDRLAEQGTLFENVIAESSWTLPTHMSLLTGLSTQVHGVSLGGKRLDPARVTLAETLAVAGYRTRGMWSGPYLHPVFGFGQGFAEQDYESMIGLTAYDGPEISNAGEGGRESRNQGKRAAHEMRTSEKIADAAIEFLSEQREDPFFLFLHFFDVHYDYNPPEAFWREFDPDFDGPKRLREFRHLQQGMEPRHLQHVLARYDGEILYTDRHLGRVLFQLEKRGLAERTLVVVTSDHGEEFFEHDKKGHSHHLFDEVLRVPLIVRLPGRIPANQRLAHQVRHVDVMPTILGLLGLEPQEEVIGTDLSAVLMGADAGQATPAISRLETLRYRWTSVRTATGKLVLEENLDSGAERALFFGLGDDPGERHGRGPEQAGEQIQAAREVLEKFDAAEARLRNSLGWSEVLEHELPLQVEAELRELGYIE